MNKALNFIGVGLALYSIALLYAWISSDSIIKETVNCKYCRKRISCKVSCLAIILVLNSNELADLPSGEALWKLHELAGWEGRSYTLRERELRLFTENLMRLAIFNVRKWCE